MKSISMGLDWSLVRCQCGHSFGLRKGTNAKCTRCGSLEVTLVEKYTDSKSLANAVSAANLPQELAKELSLRLNSKSAKEQQRQQRPTSLKSRVKDSLHRATDDQGVLHLEAIRSELVKSGLDPESWESVIGGAEHEGILVRCGTDLWRWV